MRLQVACFEGASPRWQQLWQQLQPLTRQQGALLLLVCSSRSSNRRLLSCFTLWNAVVRLPVPLPFSERLFHGGEPVSSSKACAHHKV